MDNKFKAFVIVALVVLFTGMMAGGAYIAMKISGATQSVENKEVVIKPEDVHVVELTNSITTNLVSEKDMQSNHIIKITVGFGINKKSKDFKTITSQFEEKQILIRDEIIQSLRDQVYENMTKSDAQSQLSEIIISRVSKLLATQSIEEVYFGEFFVQ